jgi:hypothetical protein
MALEFYYARTESIRIDLNAKEATETNSDSHSDNFTTKSNHIVIFFTLLTSHHCSITATSEIELRGLTQFRFFGYFVLMTSISEVAVILSWRFRVLDYSL